MKKAKEYAQAILNTDNQEMFNKQINNTFDEMVQEIKEIADQRKIKSDDRIKPIILQQKQKWAAVCRLVNKERGNVLNEDGFIQLLETVIPMTKSILR